MPRFSTTLPWILRQCQLHTTSTYLSQIPISIPIPTSTIIADTLIPSVQKCPPPTSCPCASNPTDLDIDQETLLMGTAPKYYQHVLVSTGKTDWSSKVESDVSDNGGGLAERLKSLMASKGAGLRDPFAPILITNSSFSPENKSQKYFSSAYILPLGLYFPSLPLTDTAALSAFIKAYLLPSTSSSSPRTAPPAIPPPRKVDESIILICSHKSRDSRCGAYYPPLRQQFDKVLNERGLLGVGTGKVMVAATSHLSGHKWAGNVVIYRPWKGWGAWYGRVGVDEVEGLVEETVMAGRVVRDICRGVVGGVVEVE